MKRIDPVTVEVVRSNLLAAAKDMSETLKRTATHPRIYEYGDFVVALYDSDVNLIADVPGVNIFLGTIGFCIKSSCVDDIGLENLKPGDVVLTTHPYRSSTHTADGTLIMPVFYKGKLVAYAGTKAHMGDTGAKDWYPTDTVSMYQEGLIFEAVKIWKRGELDKELWRTLLANSRRADVLAGSVNAMRNACTVGKRRITSLIEKFGLDMVRACIKEILDHGELVTRRGIQKIPEGTYPAPDDYLDDDGVVLDKPVKIKVTVKVRGNDMIVDLTGSSKAVKGPLNSPYGSTYSAAAWGFRAITAPQISSNEGCLRPLEVIAPSGSIFNPEPPAPTWLYWMSALRIMELVPRALADVLPPGKVPAGSGGGVGGVGLVSTNPHTKAFTFMGTSDAIGQGSTAFHDGENALIHYCNGGCRNTPAEVVEITWDQDGHTGEILRYELNQDSGGPGKYRGGLGIIKDYTVSKCGGDVLVLQERCRVSRPWGLHGGKPAKVMNHTILFPGTDKEKVERRKHWIKGVPPFSVVRWVSGGGGGYGDPFERDPELVHSDVMNEYVSIESAREDYGVVIDLKTLQIDMKATNELRDNNTR